jgi:hypothetical protein
MLTYFRWWIRLICFVSLFVLHGQTTAVYANETISIDDLPLIRVTNGQPRPSPHLGPRLGPSALIDAPPIVVQAGEERIEVKPNEKWIQVDLSEQKVVAYEGETPVREFIVSTGRAATPTVTGVFRMWVRTPIQDMYDRFNGSYYLEDVQWVQYFYEDYSFHGTYWHNNFGHPMSSGCVNMTNADAEWLYKWAMPEWDGEAGWLYTTDQNNTLVVVHD